MRVLIANRGEIARRIIRTAHRLGHETVAVFADPDAAAPFVTEATTSVHIGPAALADSYLSADRILEAARTSGATAVHPGYGFLAENETFARACLDADLIWVGPNPDVIASMGSKIEARGIAAAAGVPTIPGWSESQDPVALADAAAEIGFPILVKASAGGGGKGIRIANDATEFEAALTEASAEAERSFGNGDVIVERYITRPRHVEVQIIADHHGTVIDLGTRECSVQRRYQKLLEEAPAPNLEPATREAMRSAARSLATSMGYDSAGTVEFVVDDESGDFFFLEMNTRLQVEHPVTEFVTGVDLVELMLLSAAGSELPLQQADVALSGHAFEARILAENPANGFTPEIGTIRQIHVPSNVRWDAAIEAGSDITPFYDSMVAKLIVGGNDREQALAALRSALDGLVIDGLVTTAGFHRWLIDQPPVVAGRVTTRFLDETPVPEAPAPAIEAAAAAWLTAVEASGPTPTSPWFGSSLSVTPHVMKHNLGLESDQGELHEVSVGPGDIKPTNSTAAVVSLEDRRVAVNVSGHTHSFALPTRTQRWAPTAKSRKSTGDAIVAPFPAVVNSVTVAPGDEIDGDDVLVVIEAMKMLHSLRASGTSTVAGVHVSPGDQVATGDTLISFVEPEPPT